MYWKQDWFECSAGQSKRLPSSESILLWCRSVLRSSSASPLLTLYPLSRVLGIRTPCKTSYSRMAHRKDTNIRKP
jgi:hypothetical protein